VEALVQVEVEFAHLKLKLEPQVTDVLLAGLHASIVLVSDRHHIFMHKYTIFIFLLHTPRTVVFNFKSCFVFLKYLIV